MECPPHQRVPTLAAWLAYIMKQSSPPQPQFVGVLADIIHHLQRVIKIVFVCSAISGVYLIHRHQLG